MPLPPGDEPLRWEALFADLEAQLAAQESLDVAAEIAERTRRERALVPFLSRLAGQLGGLTTVDLVSGERLSGELLDLGADWILLGSRIHQPGTRHLVVSAAITGVIEPNRRAQDARMARRFGLGSALRTLSRDRATVTIDDRSGKRLSGTIDAVGADALELAEHPIGELRRPAAVTGRRLIPFEALVVIRSSD